MTREEMKRECPFICGTENLFESKQDAFLAQAEFFKNYPFVFDLLPRKHAYLIKLRFGVIGKPLKLQDIGEHLGITRERARQIIDKGLARLGEDESIRVILQYIDNSDESLLEEYIVKNMGPRYLLVKNLERAIEQKQIKIVKDIDICDMVTCDSVYMQEALSICEKFGLKTFGDLFAYLKDNEIDTLNFNSLVYKTFMFALCEHVSSQDIEIISNEIADKFEIYLKIDCVDLEKDKKLEIERIKKLNKSKNESSGLSEHVKRLNKWKNERSGLIRQQILNNLPNDISIEVVGFSNRAYNGLKASGINTLGDLIDYYNIHYGDLSKLYKLGQISINEIIDKLKGWGIDIETNYNDIKDERLKNALKNPHEVSIKLFGFMPKTEFALQQSGVYTLADLLDVNLNFTPECKGDIITKLNAVGIDFFTERKKCVIRKIKSSVQEEEMKSLKALFVEDLNLSVRTYNALKRAKINDINELKLFIAKNHQGISAIKGLGLKGEQELADKLSELDINIDEILKV